MGDVWLKYQLTTFRKTELVSNAKKKCTFENRGNIFKVLILYLYIDGVGYGNGHTTGTSFYKLLWQTELGYIFL